MGILIQTSDQPLAVFSVGAENGSVHIQEILAAQGFQSVVTGGVRYANSDQESCKCPYQIQGECRCHEVVLLVHGTNEPPITLILQCRGTWTCVYLCSSSVQQDNQDTKRRLVDLLVPEQNEPIE